MEHFPVFAFDLETNGCRGGASMTSPHHRILQMSACAVDGGGEPFDTLVRPGQMAIPAASTAIHRIDAAAVADAGTFLEAWTAFLQWLGPVKDTGCVLVAHNMWGFDAVVLRCHLRREFGTAAVPEGIYLADTLPLFRKKEPSMASHDRTARSPYALGSLYHHYEGALIPDQHNAAADVRALGILVRRHLGVDTVRRAAVPACNNVDLVGAPPSDAALLQLRQIGPVRADLLYRVLRRADPTLSASAARTVGALRAFARDRTNVELETMLRTEVHMFDDGAVLTVMAQVASVNADLLAAEGFPFVHGAFEYRHALLSGAEIEGLRQAGVNTRSLLREVFLYRCHGDSNRFRAWLLNEAHMTTMRVNTIGKTLEY
jgi:DNA polymerase III epsilon subunit-like protein